jgi:hypothetical protein
MGTSLSALDQRMMGLGFPETKHWSSTVSPSWTTKGDLSRGTVNSGGTGRERERKGERKEERKGERNFTLLSGMLLYHMTCSVMLLYVTLLYASGYQTLIQES